MGTRVLLANGALDYPAFVRARAHIFCQASADCGFSDGSYTSQCEQAAVHVALDPDPNTFSFDPAAAQRCLDAMTVAVAECRANITLPNMMLFDACMSIVTGKSPAGSPCPSLLECAPGTSCIFSVSNGVCGTECRPRPGLGETCDLGCVEGAFCDSKTRKCLARFDTGMGCAFSDECKAGLACLNKVCSTPGAIGAACGTSSDCASGICDRVATPAVCSMEKRSGERCRVTGDCAPRLVCAGTTGQEVCISPVANGGNCVAGGCQGPLSCVAGKCISPALLGEPCPNKDCVTGYCSATTGKCEPLIARGKTCDPAGPFLQCDGNAVCNPMTKTCELCQ